MKLVELLELHILGGDAEIYLYDDSDDFFSVLTHGKCSDDWITGFYSRNVISFNVNFRRNCIHVSVE